MLIEEKWVTHSEGSLHPCIKHRLTRPLVSHRTKNDRTIQLRGVGMTGPSHWAKLTVSVGRPGVPCETGQYHLTFCPI